MSKCIHCGSENIVKDIKVELANEVGGVGLEFKANFVLHGTEPFYAELCNDCGSISRLYVMNVERNWCCK